MVSSIGGGKQESMSFLVPHLKERLSDRHADTKTPDTNPDQSVWYIPCCNSYQLS